MSNSFNIDMDLLISLMEARPILWDKSNEYFKDRKRTKNAWKEVFLELRSDFEELDDDEKHQFGKNVTKRWVNARDCFIKSCKRQKMYIYKEQLQFLRKVYQERTSDDSLQYQFELSEETEEDIPDHNYAQDSVQEFQTPGPGKRKLEITDLLKEKSERHLYFFRGIIPSLINFDDDEVLEFQMEVLRTIASIRKRKRIISNQLLAVGIPPGSSN